MTNQPHTFSNVIKTLFAICVLFLRLLGKITGMTYKEISVVFNLWTQGTLLLCFGAVPFLNSVCRCFCYRSIDYMMLTITCAVFVLHFMGFQWLLMHYRGSMDEVFDQCVKDLQMLAEKWHTNYFAVNIIIFIIGWLSVIGFDSILILRTIFT